MNTGFKWIILITLIGGFFRFWDLGGNPLFVDEAWFGFLATASPINQEFIPAYFTYLTGWTSEFGLRFLSALCGTLTIPAIYYVVKEYKIEIASFVAVFPIFIFWSRMSRPYSVAGLFLVLSWKWWWMMIPAILTTPISLIGLKLIKQKKWVIVGFAISALIFYSIREDATREWTFEQFIHSSRWWYLPILTILLYIPWLKRFFTYLLQYRSTSQ